MKQDNDQLLEAFLATSGYTIRALEEAIDDLKEVVTVTKSNRMRSLYLERIEDLEGQLDIITKIGQE